MWLLELSRREMTEVFNSFSIEERKQLLQGRWKSEIIGNEKNDIKKYNFTDGF